MWPVPFIIPIEQTQVIESSFIWTNYLKWKRASSLQKKTVTNKLIFGCGRYQKDVDVVGVWMIDNYICLGFSKGRNNFYHTEKQISELTLNNSSRREKMIIRRLRICHSRMTHQYLMTSQHHPVCIKYENPLTFKHILIEGPTIWRQHSGNPVVARQITPSFKIS